MAKAGGIAIPRQEKQRRISAVSQELSPSAVDKNWGMSAWQERKSCHGGHVFRDEGGEMDVLASPWLPHVSPQQCLTISLLHDCPWLSVDTGNVTYLQYRGERSKLGDRYEHKQASNQEETHFENF